MNRNTKIKLVIGAALVPIGIALAAGGMQSSPALTGETYALYAQTATSGLPRTAYAVLPSGGGMASSEAAHASLAGVVEADVMEASITGVGDLSDASVQAYSTVSSVSILGGLIKADGVIAMTTNMTAGRNTEGSQFVNIEVNGVVLDSNVAPNTTMALPGVGSVTLNQQIAGGDGSITVNMIHVLLTDPVTGAQTGEIIVGSARSGAIAGGMGTAEALATITVMPNPVSVTTNATHQFTAVGKNANGTVVEITPEWSVLNGGGVIASTGLFTAGTLAGTFPNTVNVTSGGISGSATVSVTAPIEILGTAAANGIMAGTTITCVIGGTIIGNISLSPGTAVTGFPPCMNTGLQHVADGVAAQAQIDLTAAYNTLAALPCPTANVIGTADIGGTTKLPGVYCSGSSIGVTGTLTLDGGGDPNATFVFQAGSTLTTAGNVVLINGARARNVYWLVGSSATLGTASQWQGSVIAVASITMVTDATIVGRALARNAAVTIGTGNTITLP